MKLVIAFIFVFSSLTYGQVLPSRDTFATTSVSTPVGTTGPRPQYICCYHKNPGNNQCEMKIETGSCKGSWVRETNIKRCLALIPGYNSGAPISSAMTTGAQVLNPCPF